MKIMLSGVRLAFPALFKTDKFGTFSATGIFPKDHPAFKLVQDTIKAVATEKWGAKAPEILKALAAKDNVCLHNGDTKAEYEGYEGNFYVSARNEVRPKVLARDRSPLVPEDGKPYSGCYVNMLIELWAQDNKDYGRRVNASLLGVQFDKDGDAFSGGSVASENDFDDLGDGADAGETSGSDGDLF